MQLDIDTVRGAVTVAWFVLFIALWASAWSRRRRADYEAAARLPFEAGETCGLSHMQARTLEKKLRERFLKFMQTNGYLDAYAGATARGALKAV